MLNVNLILWILLHRWIQLLLITSKLLLQQFLVVNVLLLFGKLFNLAACMVLGEMTSFSLTWKWQFCFCYPVSQFLLLWNNMGEVRETQPSYYPKLSLNSSDVTAKYYFHILIIFRCDWLGLVFTKISVYLGIYVLGDWDVNCRISFRKKSIADILICLCALKQTASCHVLCVLGWSFSVEHHSHVESLNNDLTNETRPGTKYFIMVTGPYQSLQF